ncbi:hypothetical protein Tco_0301868, partial [Tanacetum coccineum]
FSLSSSSHPPMLQSCQKVCDGCVGDGCMGDGCVGDGCVGDGCIGAVVICLGVGEDVGKGECKGEGKCSGEWECEDVILEGEGEGLGTCSIVGKSAASCLENAFVGLFILLNTFMLREGTGYVL